MELLCRLVLSSTGYEIINKDPASPDLFPDLRLLPKTNDPIMLKNYEILSNPLPTLPFHFVDKDLFYRPRPGSAFSFVSPEGTVVSYKIKSDGFRGEEFPMSKAEKELRILCIGDSSIFGYFLNLYKSYPYRLETLLSKKTIENCRVINEGVLGFSSFQGKKYFEKIKGKLKPDFLMDL